MIYNVSFHWDTKIRNHILREKIQIMFANIGISKWHFHRIIRDKLIYLVSCDEEQFSYLKLYGATEYDEHRYE